MTLHNLILDHHLIGISKFEYKNKTNFTQILIYIGLISEDVFIEIVNSDVILIKETIIYIHM